MHVLDIKHALRQTIIEILGFRSHLYPVNYMPRCRSKRALWMEEGMAIAFGVAGMCKDRLEMRDTKSDLCFLKHCCTDHAQ